jgi:adenine/guanine phosphoribosyltransferase-like PRPP-binding protein
MYKGKVMEHEIVNVPTKAQKAKGALPKYPLHLLYLRKHGKQDTLKDELSHLQLRRSVGSPDHITTLYNQRLAKNTKRFADELAAHPVFTEGLFDVIVAPPSRSDSHMPYLKAVADKTGIPAVACFEKAKALKAGDKDVGYEEVLAAVTLKTDKLPGDIATKKRILFVDDLIADGNTAAVMITLLKPHVAPDAAYFLACVLRAPGDL